MSVTTIPFYADKKMLWAEVIRLRAEAGPPTLTACDGYCSDEARRHVRLSAAGWTFQEKKKAFGIMGTLIAYCPFCGRKLP